MMSRMSINSSSCLEEYNALTADKAGQNLLLGHRCGDDAGKEHL